MLRPCQLHLPEGVCNCTALESQFWWICYYEDANNKDCARKCIEHTHGKASFQGLLHMVIAWLLRHYVVCCCTCNRTFCALKITLHKYCADSSSYLQRCRFCS